MHLETPTPVLSIPTGEREIRGPISRRSFTASSAAAAALAIYAGEISRHEIDVTHRTIPIDNLPQPFHGFRIVQLSDIHLDEYTEPGFLERVIHRVNAIAPDLVLLTGDFISMGPLPHSTAIRAAGECGELLRTITCPLRYGILGNHDAGVGSEAVASHLRSTGTLVLINQSVPIEKSGKRIWLTGIDDAAYGKPDLALALPPEPGAPVILMVHEPDYADVIAANPLSRVVNLILSGHSHGGQVRLPGLPPPNLPPMAKKYYDGSYRLGHIQLYVNRGIGTVGLPFRFFCPPEITVFTLQQHGLI
jgi:predicted MPP superfamily phosphohydrolase